MSSKGEHNIVIYADSEGCPIACSGRGQKIGIYSTSRFLVACNRSVRVSDSSSLTVAKSVDEIKSLEGGDQVWIFV